MSNKIKKALAYLGIAVIAVGIVTDAVVLLGGPRAWQYIFNFAGLITFPFLLAVAWRDKDFMDI